MNIVFYRFWLWRNLWGVFAHTQTLCNPYNTRRDLKCLFFANVQCDWMYGQFLFVNLSTLSVLYLFFVRTFFRFSLRLHIYLFVFATGIFNWINYIALWLFQFVWCLFLSFFASFTFTLMLFFVSFILFRLKIGIFRIFLLFQWRCIFVVRIWLWFWRRK